MSIFLLYSIVKYAVSVLDGTKLITGVELPFPHVPRPIFTSTEPPSQPQSTVALAVTSSHTCPSKSPPLVVSLTLHVIVFPSGTNFDKSVFVDPPVTDISKADSKESVADCQVIPPSNEYCTL